MFCFFFVVVFFAFFAKEFHYALMLMFFPHREQQDLAQIAATAQSAHKGIHGTPDQLAAVRFLARLFVLLWSPFMTSSRHCAISFYFQLYYVSNSEDRS